MVKIPNMTSDAAYDPRYLAGIVLFNRGDFFEAHEVWESLWMETFGEEKRFYQGLIQAAVGLCHFCNGNVRGAAALPLQPRLHGQVWLPLSGARPASLLGRNGTLFRPTAGGGEPDRKITPVEEDIPEIALDPPPDEWPDPAPFLEEEK